MTKEQERLKEIEARKEELKETLESASTKEEAEAIQEEARSLATEAASIRAKIEARNELEPKNIQEEETMAVEETRMKDGKIQVRALLSTGKIAKPTAVGGVNDVAESVGTIVDDVTAIALTGTGAYVSAYKTAEATAADVVDGEEIGGTEAEFDTVTINPEEWGTVGTISNQVKKVSPLNYENSVTASALVALRAKAEAKIFTKLGASTLLGAAEVALDADYLRTLLLTHKSIPGKGGVKLYISREDLITLGKVRGTNEKKALYTITYDANTNMSGTISEGGSAVQFSVSDALAAGTQYFGQPKTIEMPMWDDYEIVTDESVYFTKNLTAYRGIQTANADLCALNGMTKVTQATA